MTNQHLIALLILINQLLAAGPGVEKASEEKFSDLIEARSSSFEFVLASFLMMIAMTLKIIAIALKMVTIFLLLLVINFTRCQKPKGLLCECHKSSLP